MPATVRVCFVCLGNICRSPTAEGIFAKLVDEAGLSHRFVVDSAGTAAWHSGEAADERSAAEARRRGVHLPSRSRQFAARDFGRFDSVLAMDGQNLRDLRALAPTAEATARIARLRSFDPDSEANADVPDPYYGGDSGFAQVFDICEAACRALLDHLVEKHGLA
jgi:protein-tyrosine phosphatase